MTGTLSDRLVLHEGGGDPTEGEHKFRRNIGIESDEIDGNESSLP